MDKSTDKLRDHVCDKGGRGSKKLEIFMDVIDGSPLRRLKSQLLRNEEKLSSSSGHTCSDFHGNYQKRNSSLQFEA